MLSILPISHRAFTSRFADSPYTCTCVKMAAMIAVLFVYSCMNAVLVGVRGKTDYYEVLGLTRSATNQEIRDSYKRLVKEWCVFMKGNLVLFVVAWGIFNRVSSAYSVSV